MDVSKAVGVRKSGQSQWSDLPAIAHPPGSIYSSWGAATNLESKYWAAIMMYIWPKYHLLFQSKTCTHVEMDAVTFISFKFPLLTKCWPLPCQQPPPPNLQLSRQIWTETHIMLNIRLCRRPHPSLPSCGPRQRLHEEDRPVQEASRGAGVDRRWDRSGVPNPGGAERGSDGEDLCKDRRPSRALSFPPLRPLASLQPQKVYDGWSPVWSEGQIRSGQHAGWLNLLTLKQHFLIQDFLSGAGGR